MLEIYWGIKMLRAFILNLIMATIRTNTYLL